MDASNETEESFYRIIKENLMKCMNLLKLTTTDPLESLEEIANYTYSDEKLRYCMATISRFPSATQPYILPVWQQIFWIGLFAAMILTAVGGNSIVIWIVLAHRRMRCIMNMFLVNLSVTDLLLALFNASFSFTFMLSSDWPFGKTYCAINNFIGTFSVAASVFTLAAISVERYIAIVKPMAAPHKITKKKSIIVIILIWVTAFLLSLPNLLYSTVSSYRYPDSTVRTVCYLWWPDGPSTGKSKMDYAYNLVIFFCTYVIPLFTIIVTYAWMVSILWRSVTIGEVTVAQLAFIKSKQKVSRMLTVVTVLFGICWLPYHVYFLYAFHNQDSINDPESYAQQAYLFIYWIAMSNSMFNPIVYYHMNGNFRKYFRQILCRCRIREIKHTPPAGHREYVFKPRRLRASTRSSLWSQKSGVTTVSARTALRAPPPGDIALQVFSDKEQADYNDKLEASTAI